MSICPLCGYNCRLFSFQYSVSNFDWGITKPCTYLHLPPPSLFQPPPSSTKLISASTQLSATPSVLLEPKYRTYLGNFPKFRPKILKLSILIENWKIWYIGGADSESRVLGQISTRKVKEVLVLFENWHSLLLKDAGSYSSISFLNLGLQNPFLEKFGPKKSNLLFLRENWNNWYLEDVDSYWNIILNFQLKIHFLAERYSGGFGTVYADQNQTKINREYTTKNVAWGVYLVMRTRGTAYTYKDKRWIRHWKTLIERCT